MEAWGNFYMYRIRARSSLEGDGTEVPRKLRELDCDVPEKPQWSPKAKM